MSFSILQLLEPYNRNLALPWKTCDWRFSNCPKRKRALQSSVKSSLQNLQYQLLRSQTHDSSRAGVSKIRPVLLDSCSRKHLQAEASTRLWIHLRKQEWTQMARYNTSSTPSNLTQILVQISVITTYSEWLVTYKEMP